MQAEPTRDVKCLFHSSSLHAVLWPFLLLLALSLRSSYYFHNHFLVRFVPLTEQAVVNGHFVCKQVWTQTASSSFTSWKHTGLLSAHEGSDTRRACQVPRAILKHAARWGMPLPWELNYAKQKLIGHPREEERGISSPVRLLQVIMVFLSKNYNCSGNAVLLCWCFWHKHEWRRFGSAEKHLSSNRFGKGKITAELIASRKKSAFGCCLTHET